MALVITVNGTKHTVRASPDTPLLYVLRNELHLQGPHFGCGLAQCGACAVLLGHRQIRMTQSSHRNRSRFTAIMRALSCAPAARYCA